MKENRPSRTALKVALGVVSLGVKPGMEKVLPPGSTAEKVGGERDGRYS